MEQYTLAIDLEKYDDLGIHLGKLAVLPTVLLQVIIDHNTQGQMSRSQVAASTLSCVSSCDKDLSQLVGYLTLWWVTLPRTLQRALSTSR